MKDFSICIPTRFVVGRGAAAGTGREIVRCGGKRVLLVHDGGSYLKELLETVADSVREAGLALWELPEPALSPSLSLIRRGVAFAREKEADFILAVGGGTVMDTAKGIAFLAANEGELEEYVLYRKESPFCLPCGCICTLSGTGSEISATAMILDDGAEPPIKYPLFQESLRFAFSILDPALTLKLPMKQTLSGAFDAFTHVMERYFNGESGYDMQDRLCEGMMRSLMENMREVVKNPEDYEVRAQLQMGATLANSNLLGLGCDSDWAVHYMENPITTATHQPHGWDLAIIAPAWYAYTWRKDVKKYAQFARRVLGVPRGESPEAEAAAGAEALKIFLKEVGMSVSLASIGIREEELPDFVERAFATAGAERLGNISRLSREEVLAIYQIAL